MSAAGARVKFPSRCRHFSDGPVRQTRVPRNRVLRLPEMRATIAEGGDENTRADTSDDEDQAEDEGFSRFSASGGRFRAPRPSETDLG